MSGARPRSAGGRDRWTPQKGTACLSPWRHPQAPGACSLALSTGREGEGQGRERSKGRCFQPRVLLQAGRRRVLNAQVPGVPSATAEQRRHGRV